MQVGLGPGHIVLDGDPAPPPLKGHSPQFWAHICCGQMAAWIKMSLGMELGLGPDDFVLDGDFAPPPKKGAQKGAEPPKFSVQICCGQMAGWIKMPLGREVDLSPSDIVLDGDPAPPPQKGRSPQFSIHVYCGQTAGWIKMALGTEVCLGPATLC